MGFLARLIAIAATTSTAVACYAPELRDCTLTCSASADCAEGQVCGSDQLCAAPEIAGRCRELPGDGNPDLPDAGLTDAMMPDARDATPDAMTYAALSITIEGKGRVLVHGFGTCSHEKPQDGKCTFFVPLSTPLVLDAMPDPDWRFDQWKTAPCASAQATCTFTSTQTNEATARFRKGDGD